MQIIQPCIAVIAISPITERIIRRHIVRRLGNGVSVCVIDAGGCTPWIIAIGCNQGGVVGLTVGIVVAAVQGNHNALNILAEIVILPVGRRCGVADAKANRAVALIVEIPQSILLGSVGLESLLCNRQSLDYIVFGIAAVEVGFPRPDAAGVVLIIVGFTSEPQVD